jgi:hypothetical protein
MKHALWTSAGLVVTAVLAIFLLEMRDKDFTEVRTNLATLTATPGIQLVDERDSNGYRVLGGRLEQKLRDLFDSDHREVIFHMDEYHFQNSEGAFVIQIWETGGRISEVDVRTEKTTPVIAATLKKLFPDANHVVKP